MLPAAHAAYQDFDSFTAPTGAAMLVYSPANNALVFKNSASAVALVDIPSRAPALRFANAQFTDIALSPSGRFLFAADYGGENIGYGTPLTPSYVHRLDLVTRSWQQRDAVIAGRVEAVSDTRLILQSLDQWVTISHNEWGTGAALVHLNSMSWAVYSGDFRYDSRTGRLLHGNTGSSSQEIAAFRLAGNQFFGQESSGTYGSAQGHGGTMVLSTDGSRFYYGNLQVDALDVAHNIRVFPELIYAANGRFAFGNGKYYDAGTGALAGTLPFAATVYAMNPFADDFWAYDPATNTVHHFAELAGVVTPGALAFDATLAGTPSPAQAITVRNISNGPVTVASATATGGYAVASNNCGTLAAYATCTIGVTFTPAAAGSTSGSLTIGYAGGATAVVSLNGLGVATALTLTPEALDFGGMSMGITSPPRSLAVANNLSTPVTITSVTPSAGYEIASNGCGTIAAFGTCTFTATFTPAAQGTIPGSIVIGHGIGGPTSVALTGVGERSLVSHYYQAILGRAPDAPGKAFWDGEAQRMGALGADPNEVWYVLAGYFFNGAEYASRNRTNAQFVSDLYETFFNREGDVGGLAFWGSQLQQGMPREVVMLSFLFTPEFRDFTTGLFGSAPARPEVDMVMDFYRGILNRLPDDQGFAYYREALRAAQCNGAAAVRGVVNDLSYLFLTSPEYATRARNNTEYVTDLYYAFLRRGGDLTGVNFWIAELASGRQSREQVRREGFLGSVEFTQRVDNLIAAGCAN